MAEAEDCLAGYLFDEQLDGHKLPEPTPLDKVNPHREDAEDWQYKKAFVNLVSVDVAAYARQHFSKPVKKTLSIPK